MKRGTTECILKLNSILRGEKNPFSQVKSWKVHKADLRCLEFFNFIHGFISPSLKTTWQSTILLLIYNSPQHLSRTGWDCAGPFHVSPVSFSLHKDPLRKYNYTKGEIDSDTIIVEDFYTSLSSMDRSSRQKINKETRL